MARARNIKPAFFQNEELGELSPIDRLAFIGMWTIADFKGCIEFRPKRLKVQLMPYDECDFETIAINLDKSGFIRMYSVQGQRYIKILNFEKHQNPHKNERDSGSDIPDIDKKDNEINESENIENNPEQDGTAPADSLIPLTESLNPQTDSGTPPAKIQPLTSSLSGFDRFYAAYPKKRSPEDALKAWNKKKPPIDDVLSALAWQVTSKDWIKDKGQYIPYPASYINSGGWRDEKPSEEDFSDWLAPERDITNEVNNG